MIVQTDFIDEAYLNEMLALTKMKKPNKLLEKVKFETIADGKCNQMMHIGSYDNEPTSFQLIEEFASSHNLIRKSKVHQKIYLSDFWKVAEEKLKSGLRFCVEG
ncbi:MAG: hypothetical protein ACI86M_001274 [Saprospiraceae bacterium]|jgi:hypothetical protein